MKSKHVDIVLVLASIALWFTAFATADVVYKIPVEHNHRVGECQGTLIVRTDKVIFESRNRDCSRVWNWDDFIKIKIRDNGYIFDVYFHDRTHGNKKTKYVMKFTSANPENKHALDYILSHMNSSSSSGHSYSQSENHLPFRLDVSLDLNGPDCDGTLVFRKDQIIFETSGSCADRAFVRAWGKLKGYRRVKSNEFLLVFYKYGRSAPNKVVKLRFRTRGGTIPPEIHYLLTDAVH